MGRKDFTSIFFLKTLFNLKPFLKGAAHHQLSFILIVLVRCDAYVVVPKLTLDLKSHTTEMP